MDKREISFNAWIPELEYMLKDVAVGHGSIGFGSDDEDFAEALRKKGYNRDNCEFPEWLYDSGEDWYHLMDEKQFVLLQFTGLKDKNGNGIFEGDLINYGNETRVVVFKNAFWFDDNPEDYAGGFGTVPNGSTGLKPLYRYSDIEVVGNIYQPDTI